MSNPFLSSMTFATHDFRAEGIGCDCDDCGIDVHIPPRILESLQARKRQKRQEAIKRSQSRILVNRGPNAVSLYSWILPHQAEPLVEFGSSHRIVWVSRLPSEGSIFSIGTGIIGSSDEEKSRTRMDWKDGGIYLVPSNGGKAVGFVYHASDSSEQGSGHAELKIAKIPQEMLIDSQGKSVVHFSKDDAAPYHLLWANSLEEKCRDLLESERTQTPTGNLLLPSVYYFVGAHNVDALKTAFRDGESASNKRSSNS